MLQAIFAIVVAAPTCGIATAWAVWRWQRWRAKCWERYLANLAEDWRVARYNERAEAKRSRSV